MADAAAAAAVDQRVPLRGREGSGGDLEPHRQGDSGRNAGGRGTAAAAADARVKNEDDAPAAAHGESEFPTAPAVGGAAARTAADPQQRTAGEEGRGIRTQAATAVEKAACDTANRVKGKAAAAPAPTAAAAPAPAAAAAPAPAAAAAPAPAAAPAAASAAASAAAPAAAPAAPAAKRKGSEAEEDDDLLQRLTEIESLCTHCGENGKTLMLLHRVPHFKDILISSFCCPHCGYSNREVEGVGPLAAHGVRLQLQVAEEEDLKRQVVISEFATLLIPDVELEIPPSYTNSNSRNRRSAVKTVEGILHDAAEALAAGQEARRAADPDVAARIDTLVSRLRAFAEGASPFRLQLDDPSGNSYIEALPSALEEQPRIVGAPTVAVSAAAASSSSSSAAPAAGGAAPGSAAAARESPGVAWVAGEATGQDSRLKKEYYTRSREQLHAMGYYEQQQEDGGEEKKEDAQPEGDTNKRKEAAAAASEEERRVWDLSKPLEDAFGEERYRVGSASCSTATGGAAARGEGEKRRGAAGSVAAAADEGAGAAAEEDADDIAGWSLPVDCPHCGVSGSNRICEIDVPGFRRCLIFSFLCNACGARETEVKPAGAFGPAGRRWTLRVETQEDLNRDVLKSDVATVCIPSLQLTMQGGTQGGDFTTVEGLLDKLADSLESTTAFASGDSAPPERRERVLAVTAKLRAMKAGPAADAAEGRQQSPEEESTPHEKSLQSQQEKSTQEEQGQGSRQQQKEKNVDDGSFKPFLLIVDDCADTSFIGGRRSHAVALALLKQKQQQQEQQHQRQGASAVGKGGATSAAAEKRETPEYAAADEKQRQQQQEQLKECEGKGEKQENDEDEEQKQKEAALSPAAIAAASEGQILWTERRDSQLLTEIYKRTLEQDDELGLSDMQV